MRIRSSAWFVVAGVAFAACDGSVTPPPSPSAVYTLTAPAVLQSPSVRMEILSETLSLYPNGSAQREFRQRVDYVDPAGRDTTAELKSAYTYTVTGDSIAFAAACNDTALCAPPPHAWGKLTSDGLELRLPFDPAAVLRYRRLYPPD